MSKVDRIYRPTEAGLRALEMPDASTSEAERQILRLLDGGAHWHELRKRLTRLDEHQRLAELEKRGLVRAEAAQGEADLDFTGNFVFGRQS